MNITRVLCWTIPIFLWNGFRLLLFVVSLTPGFFRFAWYYTVAANRESVRYGDESVRQTLDVYRSSSSRRSISHQGEEQQQEERDEECRLLNAPVLVFYTGGAWIIGYKMWGSFLARALTAAGIVVVIPDMRNYPWATVPDMVRDVDQSLDWTINNIARYGGNPDKIVVVGQSAGGHVACMAIFEKIQGILQRETQSSAMSSNRRNMEMSGSWSPSDLKGFATVSSPFSLRAMEKSFQMKGLDDHLVDRIFGYQNDKYDPFLALQEFQKPEHIQRVSQELPPIHIYHGTADATVPYEGSEAFYGELQKIVTDERRLSFVTYPGWSHTDPILEGPMDADQSHHKDLFRDVKEWTDSSELSWPENNPVIKARLCPHFLVEAGRFFNPF